MEFSEIIDTFGKVAAFHSGNKDMLYFGEGSKEGIEACKRALFLLKQSADFTVFKKQTAVAYHKIFPIIKNHLDQIRQNYLNNEEKLLFVLLKKLVPGKLNPLKFKVLSQMSLCSAPVQLNSSLFKPAPITGFVDGYYNFVIPVGGSIIRIPLIPKDGVTPVALPPSIRFVGSDKEKKNAQDFIVNRAPKIGRIYQFNAFVSALNRSDPRLGPVNEFKDALTSFDLSFATALAALSYDNLSKRYLNNMINVLGCNEMLDHFIRTLATCSRLIVSSTEPDDCVQFAALANIFSCSSFLWSDDINQSFDITLEDLLELLCVRKLRHLPPLSLYVLRAALVIACYQDAGGDTAIAMFMELVIRPFVKKYYLEAAYLDAKEKILRKDDEVRQSSELIKRSIITVLGMNISIDLCPSKVDKQMEDLYDFALSRVGDIVNLVMILNSKTKENNPVLQTLVFAYKTSLDNDVDKE